MSLTLCITTPEGIVLAADSRQSYQNNVNVSRVGSDSATKIFHVDGRIGITIAGPAFLPDPDNPGGNQRGIGTFIQEVLEQLDEKDTVKIVTDKLSKHLDTVYKPGEQIKQLETDMEKQLKQLGATEVKKNSSSNEMRVIMDYKDNNGKPQTAVGGVIPISLIVSGYDMLPNGKKGINSYIVNIPGDQQHKRQHGTPNQYGADWTGQTDVITRIVLGFDPRIGNLSFLKTAEQSIGANMVKSDLSALEYNINWGAMTLHDAIAFAKLMIETTSAIQRFSDGIRLTPGDMPGVGGPVDVAVILPDEGFHWHQRKELKLEKPTS